MPNEELTNAIIKGSRKLVAEIVQAAVDNNDDIPQLLTESMIPAMKVVGDKFARNEVYVPEMLIAARAMQAGLNIIDPILAKSDHKPLGKVCIGTVKGDLHDIGKNLVAMMLKGAGFEVEDIGVDCDVDDYQEAIDNGAEVVCCSALLTTTMPYMFNVTKHFKDSDTKVVIGGAPITQEYADQIGAGGYANNASDAVKAVSECLGLSA